MSNVTNETNEVFAAIEGAAHAALDGESGPQIGRLKQELEKLSASDVEEMKRAKVSPARWAELFLSALALGKKVRDVIRDVRKLP